MLAQFDALVQSTRSFGYGMRGGGYGLWNPGTGFPVGFILAALVFAGLVAAVIVLSVRLARRGHRPSESIEIVKARYARGEISKNEFEELKKDLI
jgi:putative membrane protein